MSGGARDAQVHEDQKQGQGQGQGQDQGLGQGGQEARARRLAKAERRWQRLARGLAPRDCPVCGYAGSFTPFGLPPRIDAQCGGCGALERHRLYALTIAREAPFGAADRVLHFAAEPHLRRLIRPRVAAYETAEIRASTNPTHVLDITAIALGDAQYDHVVANHVLEHVDDRAALSEIFRILRPGGTAWLTTPVVEGWAETYENPEITEPAERELHFGQRDHLRLYGRDIRDRIRAAGFALREITAREPDVHRHALLRGETIFVATRPA